MNTLMMQRRVQALAEMVGGRVRSYSGRGMYGEECIAVVCDDAGDAVHEAGALGPPKPRTDSMGRGEVAYWPGIPAPAALSDTLTDTQKGGQS